MDKLKKYIDNHREQFDSDEPRDDLWSRISGELNPPKAKQRWLSNMKVWRAAAVILLLATSWLVFDKVNREDAAQPTSDSGNGVLAEFREVENFYMTLVAEKRNMLEKASADDPEYRREFLSELEELDNQYKGLKENLKFGNQEEVINALIVNLQLRIEILNRQLEIIQQLDKKEKGTAI